MTKKFDLSDYLKKDEAEEIVYKPLQYVMMPKCFQDAIGLPGIALGHMSLFYGLSDSGKTEVMLNVAQEAIKQDILPVLIITENKMEKERLLKKGLIPGENCIVEENITTLEDAYDYISMKVEDAKTKKLKMNTLILWDSVAGTPSKDSFEVDKDGRISKKYGPQKNASVIGYYNPIIAKRVASTREMDCDYSIGVFMVTQAYKTMPEFPGAPVDIYANGGEKIWFPMSLSVCVKEGKRFKVTVDKRNYEIGLLCKLKVKKNHINGVYTDGEVVFGENEMFPNDEKLINAFKEKFKNED